MEYSKKVATMAEEKVSYIGNATDIIVAAKINFNFLVKKQQNMLIHVLQRKVPTVFSSVPKGDSTKPTTADMQLTTPSQKDTDTFLSEILSCRSTKNTCFS